MTVENFFGKRELSQLSDDEKLKHYHNVCEAAGIDPNLNLLRYRMMDDGSGTGQKHLVLYATKGATNAIRAIQAINVTKLGDKVVNGAYVVTAYATNKDGRTDAATGAAQIEGKTGRELENSFALAQTRATRRVTLQLSGLDLLDESELNSDGKNPVSDAPTPLPVVQQPTAKPNSAAGTDITLPEGVKLKVPGAKVEYQVALPKNSGTAVVVIPPDGVPAEVVTTEVRLKNPAAGLRVANDNLAGPGLKREGRVVEVPVQTAPIIAAQAEAIASALIVDSIPAEPLVKKPRKKRASKTAAPEIEGAPVQPRPGDVTVVDPAAEAEEQPGLEAKARPVAAPGAVATTTSLTMPNAAQQMEYAGKIKDLRAAAETAGMHASAGLSVGQKFKKFLTLLNNGVDNPNAMTNAQWVTSLKYFDDVVSKNGIKNLVDTIELNVVGEPDVSTAA